MTLDELAQMVKVSESQVSRLENGLQSFKTEMLAKLAKVFRVPVFSLLMSNEEWTQYQRGRKKR